MDKDIKNVCFESSLKIAYIHWTILLQENLFNIENAVTVK